MNDVDTSGVRFVEGPLTLAGVSFSIPVGWERVAPSTASGMISATRKAQFRLPKTDNEPEDVTIAITHFPGMKGMDEANLARWYGQFTQPDGRPTVSVATRLDVELDGASFKLVDIPGTMGSAGPMMGGGGSKKNYRMLAAIIDHAEGPHFLKATGPSVGVERWKSSIVAFLKSAKVSN